MFSDCGGWTRCDRGHDPHQSCGRRPGHERRAGELGIVEKRSQCIEPGSWRKMRAGSLTELGSWPTKRVSSRSRS